MDRRKELREQYKNRKITGGVYRLLNRENGKYFLKSTDEMKAAHSFFKMCYDFDNCTLPSVAQDWKTYGREAFCIEELDLLEKGEDQTTEEYRRDLKTLYELWEEKLPRELRYG